MTKEYRETTHGHGTTEAVLVANEGQRVMTSNYWRTEMARQGLYYCSGNAGALRLFVPDRGRNDIEEMKTGRQVIVTHGYDLRTNASAYEIMFEDDSECPFFISVSDKQVDRSLAELLDTDETRDFIVYSDGPQEELRLTARFRSAPTLPYLKAWGQVSSSAAGNRTSCVEQCRVGPDTRAFGEKLLALRRSIKDERRKHAAQVLVLEKRIGDEVAKNASVASERDRLITDNAHLTALRTPERTMELEQLLIERDSMIINLKTELATSGDSAELLSMTIEDLEKANRTMKKILIRHGINPYPTGSEDMPKAA